MSKPIILIVDDEPAIIDTIQYALETEGCVTLAAQTGQGAQDILGRERVDLIILDVGLPDVNGMDLLKRIRQQSSVPVVFLTARSGDIDRVLGLELGGDDYVVKPFSPRELAARVKAVLRRSQRPSPLPGQPLGQLPTAGSVLTSEGGVEQGTPPASFASGSSSQTACTALQAACTASAGAWRVDAEKRSVVYWGTPLDLSRYEYNLLCVFLQSPGHVLTRDQLMERAWEEPEMSMDRTVDAHVKKLRAKLKAVRPDEDPIITYRGVGYALKEQL